MWALAGLVVLGEEISWGQRIFGFATPEGLAAVNYQREFNFHNLDFVREHLTDSSTSVLKANLFSLVMMIIGVALPMAALTPIGRNLMQRFAFPVVPAAYMVIFIGGLLYAKFLRTSAAEPVCAMEVREWIWSMGYFMFALHGLFRPHDLYRLPRGEFRTSEEPDPSARPG